MSLLDERVLYVDCQTTGRSPAVDGVIEIAWAESEGEVASRLVAPPEGRPLTREVQRITGISEDDVKDAPSAEAVWGELLDTIRRRKITALVIHYAQFERPFLVALRERYSPTEELPPILCTHRLAKRVLPRLTSGTLRGVSGHLGAPLGELRRAGDHVKGTRHVWRALAGKVAESGGPESCGAMASWLDAKAPKAKGKTARTASHTFLLPRERRLAFPARPGIYHMIGADGAVLYVGKATSLRDRVNSYFRQRRRGGHVGELLAQVVDIRVLETDNTLEAALAETDAIKRFDPPYNRVLRESSRRLRFFSAELDACAEEPSEEFPLGPFSSAGVFDPLRLLREIVAGRLPAEGLYPEVDDDTFAAGWDLFQSRARRPLDANDPTALWIAEGFRQRALERDDDGIDDKNDDEEDDDAAWTAGDVAASAARLLARTAGTLAHAAQLRRLAECVVAWPKADGNVRCLVWRGGECIARDVLEPGRLPAVFPDWDAASRARQRAFSLASHDRLRVLRSELRQLVARGVALVLQPAPRRFLTGPALARALR